MAVSFVGAGGYVSGNNASLTPSLPSGLQNGDFLLLLASIRENAATINTPSGWGAGIGGTVDVNHYSRIFSRFYQAGVTAPTVTFSGGGSNDTTQAIILSFRGVKTTGSLSTGTLSAASFNYFNVAGRTPYSTDDGLFTFRVWENDSALTDLATTQVYTGSWSSPVSPTASNNFSTTQGADASLSYAFQVAQVNYVSGSQYVMLQESFDSLMPGQQIALVIYGKKSYPYTGTGGIKFGGAATSVYRKSILNYVASGGIKFGGSALSHIRYPVFPYTGTGGIKFGGSGNAYYRKSIMPYTGSGGIKFGGSAATSFVSPTTYHIDYFNGNDNNDGLSWATAFKTFHPIGDKEVTLFGGDRVKIAKTPDPVNRGITSVEQLTKSSSFSTIGPASEFPNSTLWTSNLKVLHSFSQPSSEGAWQGQSASWAQFVLPSGYSSGNYPYLLLRVYVSGYLQDRVLAYYAPPATVNLSSFSRLELPVQLDIAAAAESPSDATVVDFCLCSDTLGQTVLLRIRLDVFNSENGLVVYEGTLPDGVNSYSFRSVVAGTLDTRYVVHSFIACRAATHADYIGRLTQFRLGSHEGALWNSIRNFTINSSGQIVALMRGEMTANASTSSTLTLHTRTAVSWGGIGLYEPGSQFSSVGVRGTLYPTGYLSWLPEKVLFNLVDISGSPGASIRILGGYDPITDTVTGKTALLSSVSSFKQVGAIALASTEHIYFSDLDILDTAGPFLAMDEKGVDLRFNNCELAGLLSYDTTNGAPANPKTQSGAILKLDEIEFKNCTGQLCLSSFYVVAAPILDNCIVSWYATYLGTTLSSIVMKGPLKFYCMPHLAEVPGNTDSITDTTRLKLPTIFSNDGWLLSVHCAGSFYIYPQGNTAAPDSSYTYPKMWLQNSTPVFGGSNYLSYAEVPEITFTSAATEMGQTGPALRALVSAFDTFMPTHVKKITATGARSSASGSRELSVIRSGYGGAHIQVSDVNVTGLTGYDYCMVSSRSSGDADQEDYAGVYSNLLSIVDGFVSSPRSYVASTWLVGGTNTAPMYGSIDLRNVSLSNTSSANHIYCTPAVNQGVRARFVGCAISNPSQPPVGIPDSFYDNAHFSADGSTPWNYEPIGLDCGILFEDSTIIPQSSFGALSPGSTEFSFTRSQNILDPRRSIVISQSSPKSYVVYSSSAYKVEKDYTITDGGEFSWTTYLFVGLVSPFSFNLPLATIPVRAGKVVTVSINTRRSSQDARCGLVVQHNGCAGYATPQDYQEYVSLNSAANNVWQTVQVQFVCQKGGWIDIHWSHFGVEGLTAWFAGLRVDEV